MKELSIEEKAEAYERAIERAIKHRNNDGLTLEQYETIDIIFPELKGPTDKIELKFKVGDYVVGKYISGYISEVRDDCYILGYQGFSINKQDNYHLWTIQDAKDGDVLACESGWACIFKSLNDGDTFSSYCFMDRTKSFFETGSECHTLKEEFMKAYNGKIYPATKEQRDALMKAMADAGYTFDFEKKELKEIEQKSAEKNVDNRKLCDIVIEELNKYSGNEAYKAPWALDSTGVQYPLYFAALGVKWQKERKSVWSEEDDRMLDKCIKAACSNYYPGISSVRDWLRGIKDRVQPQQKQEWSEEDETNASYIFAALDCYYRLREERNNTNGQENLDKARNWLYNKLKTFRPQPQWKPSDEQMMALRWVLNHIPYDSHKEEISGLLDQIKDL